MSFETHIYKHNVNLKTFCVSITGVFTDAVQEEFVDRLEPYKLDQIKNIMWCVNAVGYVELYWDMPDDKLEKICVLSGNGRWDLNSLNMDFISPKESQGRLILNTHGFDDLDSYTIVIQGIHK